MQTFLTSGVFSLNARNIDSKRLNKQLLEGRQILSALFTGKGWIHHPATKMWAGGEEFLYTYLGAIRHELDNRGIKTDKNWAAIEELRNTYEFGTSAPSWFNEYEFNKIRITHRGRLYEKDPSAYWMFSEEAKIYQDYVCCKGCNYYWPTHVLDRASKM